MDCIALQRRAKRVPEWLISNGMNMGRWTRHFGVHCLADSPDCKAFVRDIQDEEFPEATMHHFTVTEVPHE